MTQNAHISVLPVDCPYFIVLNRSDICIDRKLFCDVTGHKHDGDSECGDALYFCLFHYMCLRDGYCDGSFSAIVTHT